MQDRDLYATILRLAAPWTVERVEVDLKGSVVHVWLQREERAAVECPECHTAQTIYDHHERELRHLDTCQLETRLHAHPAGRLSDARRAANRRAVGDARLAVHDALRATGDRLVADCRDERGRAAPGDQLG